MPRTSLVREDEKSIYVKVDGYIFRPGGISGYAHAYDMSSGNLKAGDHVKAHHLSQTPIAKITTENGTILHWGEGLKS